MEEIREGAFLRKSIELACAELLAEIIIDEQITELRRNLRLQKVMVEDGDFAEFYRLDGEMHDLIIGFTGFKQLSTIAKTGWVHVDRARQLILPMGGWRRHSKSIAIWWMRLPRGIRKRHATQCAPIWAN